MLKKIFLIILFAFGFIPLNAQTLSEAEKLYQDGDFAKAIPLYEQIIQTADGDTLLQAQLRKAASQYALGEYMNATKTMFGYALPSDNIWQARFRLYRIQMAKQVSSLYNRLLEKREIDSPDAKADLETWTRAQWQEQIEKEYEALWALRTDLINAPTESENLILNLKDTDTRRLATLFDFATNGWIQWINANEVSLSASAPRTYLNGQAQIHPTARNKAGKLAEILDTAAALEGTNRQDARLFWKTDAILLPLEHENWFTISDKEKAVQAAVSQLNALYSPVAETKLWNKIKNYFSPEPEQALYAKTYTLYRTAELLNRNGQKAQALQVCNEAQNFPSSYYTQQCKNMAQQITRPEFSFNALPKALVPQTPSVEVSARNIDTLYGRVYPVTFQELKSRYEQNYKEHGDNSWAFLHEINQQDISFFLKSDKKYTSFSQSLTYKTPYTRETFTLQLPPLENSFYVLLVSEKEAFNPAQAPVYAIVLNSTDLALFATAAIEDNPQNYIWTLQSQFHTKNPTVFRFYTLNLKTGEPEADVNLDIITGWKEKHIKLKTGSEGTAALARAITLGENQYTSHSANIVAVKNNTYTYTPSAVYFHYSVPAAVRLFAQTDRAVYRPGQKVHLSVNAFQRTVTGQSVLPDVPLTVIVTNAAGEKIFSTSLTTNPFGSAQTSFTLPNNNPMLGSFRVRIDTNKNGRSYHAYHSFEVEEYKRPDYEIALTQTASLQYDKESTLTGHAQYYFGTPLQEATVKYTVTRQPYWPPFYWWWFNRPHITEEQVAQGETKTDKNGDFKISFTPRIKQKDEQFAQYRVTAEVYDESGRAISDTRTYKVSLNPHLFKVTLNQGFYDADTPLPAFAQLDLTNADGQSVSGKITFRIAKLKNEPDTTASGNSVETWYQNTPEEKNILTQTLSFQSAGAQTVNLPALAEGIYRLTLKSPQAAQQQIHFIVVKDGKNLILPDITLPQQTAYYVGETARVLLGNSNLTNTKWLEIYQQSNFLVHKEKLSGGVSLFEFPVTEKHRGGISFAWFGASQYHFYTGTSAVEVPFDNKEIVVSVNAPAVSKPSQQTDWTLSAFNRKNQPLNGQASISVYDKSLDYYAKKQNPFALNTFYPQQLSAAPQTYGYQTGYTVSVNKTKDSSYTQTTAPVLPTINLQMPRRMFKGAFGATRNFARAAAPQMLEAKALSADALADSAVMEERAVMYSRGGETLNAMASGAAPSAAEAEQEPPAESIRTDFAETAYFNAQLPVTNGKGSVRFTLPDSLTAWNIIGFVLTKNTDLGTFTASTLTRKDFMVRLQLPRFYREGDKGVLQAAVTNLTDQKITVPVSLTIRKENNSANKSFGIIKNQKTVTVAPNETAFASWDITAPDAPDVYQITASARLGTTSDGEQKDFLILPGYARLLATANKALKAGTNKLSLTEVLQDATAKPETAVLNLHPSLALSVLNSMPHLLMTPYQDLVSSLNRYVPLAVVNQFYTTYPQLKQAVQKLPKRTGLTAPWNEKDPLRLTLLDQTPWLRQARGRQTPEANIIDLFDANKVTAQLRAEEKNIAKFQNANGAFTWLPKGPDDDYLTLYALESFAQALHYNAQIPQAAAKKAFSYIVPRIERHLKDDKSGSESAVSFALYAAYTLSSFPQTWPQVAQAKAYIQRWADYADGQARFMTPLGQIYAAAVYHRLGDDVKANQYLDKVLSRLKQNDLIGAYFAPEPQSWVWYNDTLTTQTITLRTLLEIRPNAKEIDSMLQWILFNRQVNEWNNSKATAQTVFTVMDVMQAQGVFDGPVTYAIDWADAPKKLTFHPFDWTADLQFVQSDSQITPQTYQAQITKQGGSTDFASLSVRYLSKESKPSAKGVINIQREYFVRFTQEGTQKLKPVSNLSEVKVGDEVEVHLTLTTDSAFEYLLLDDPKPAGFESEDLHSGWTYNTVSLYREVKDDKTRFFINWLPAGKVTLRYVLRPTLTGQFHLLPAQIQSMFAPEYGAHTGSLQIGVAK